MKYLCLFLVFIASCSSKNWRQVSRQSAGLAPLASEQKEDIIQIYYARAYSWRGYFAVHPWISWKKADDTEYTVAQVTSWNLRRGGLSAISEKQDLPDRQWFGSAPTLLFEAKAEIASIIIAKLKSLIKSYPFKSKYRIWPGPNSNTFVSYMIRHIDEISAELPPHAIGKDYLGASEFIVASPYGPGFQLSVFGLLGLTLGVNEGIEVNLLGLNFGVDFWTPALKVPFAGRIGFQDSVHK